VAILGLLYLLNYDIIKEEVVICLFEKEAGNEADLHSATADPIAKTCRVLVDSG